METDTSALRLLMEQSADIHHDAMATTRSGLAALEEIGRDTAHEESEHEHTEPEHTGERHLARHAGSGIALGVGLGALALGGVAAAASTSDVQILQSAQSIENLAISTYTLALTLPFIGGSSANGVVKAFVTETRKQHQDHASAFAAAIRHLGGKPQSGPDPVLAAVVAKAKPSLTNAAAVVALAIELEDGAAQTYVADCSRVKNTDSRNVLSSIMGVEAQHVAVLRAVQALLAGNAASLIALPPKPLSALPKAAGGVGFPAAFYPTTSARPANEGALTK